MECDQDCKDCMIGVSQPALWGSRGVARFSCRLHTLKVISLPASFPIKIGGIFHSPISYHSTVSQSTIIYPYRSHSIFKFNVLVSYSSGSSLTIQCSVTARQMWAEIF